MIAILAENESDVCVLEHVIRTRLNISGSRLFSRGYDGSGNLMRSAPRDIRNWERLGVRRFVVCLDADGPDPEQVAAAGRTRIIGTGRITYEAFFVVPVQAIEAWLIADELAINAVLPSFRFGGHDRPESIDKPKKWLVRQSRRANGKPLYSNAFNRAIAHHLRCEVVASKCPSFRRFLDWLDAIERGGT